MPSPNPEVAVESLIAKCEINTEITSFVFSQIEQCRKRRTQKVRVFVLIYSHVGRVRVYVRARPPSAGELADSDFAECTDVSPEEQRITVKREFEQPKHYYFDNVFKFNVTQEEVFQAVAKPVVDVLQDL